MNQQLYSYCIQGDVQKAYDYLLSIEKNKSLEKLTKKYYNRFFSTKPIFRYKTKDLWIRSILRAYYEYFILVLTKKENKEDVEKILVNRLNDFVPKPLADLDQIETVLEEEFKARGYYFLGGITAPFRGPYIWSGQEKIEYNVLLPSGNKTVTVYFLTDFILKSWLDFATFGKIGTGGWATSEALYCVKKSYEKVLDKPSFLYSYLAHEAQHFTDYEDFPKLVGKDLEYRAKLVELIYHPLNHSLIKTFITNAVCDMDNPHLYANYILCANLSKKVFNRDFEKDVSKWGKIDHKTISNAALKLFQNHTELLISIGRENVGGVI